MPDIPTDALVRLSRIQRHRNTVSLATQAEVSLPTGQPLHASGPLSPLDVLTAHTIVCRGAR